MTVDRYCNIGYNSYMSTKIPTKTLPNNVAKSPQFSQTKLEKSCKKVLTGISIAAIIVA
jgi:hypothetical protein